MLAVRLLFISFILLSNIPSFPSFFRAFIMKAFWFCQRLFLHLLRGSGGFSPWFC
jgi:hypothetical protein